MGLLNHQEMCCLSSVFGTSVSLFHRALVYSAFCLRYVIKNILGGLICSFRLYDFGPVFITNSFKKDLRMYFW